MSDFRFLPIAGAVLIALTGCNNAKTTSTSSPEGKISPANPTETTAESKDVEYMSALALMKGHLIVAKELLDQGKPDQAEPHIGHPVEELYGDVESQLPERKVSDFKSTLNQLHDLVKSAPDAPQVTTEFQASIKAIDGAIEALPEIQRQSPQFVLKVINRLLETAQEEYEAAIIDGKVVELVEYQDSRGFVIYAETLYQNISEQMSQKHPDAHQGLESALTELKKAWPSVNPPQPLAMTPEQVSQLIATIKENSEKVSS
ncbi:MAG: hypothetical protein AB4426_27980 [Xenococcaceae cyanobacterium]